MPISTLRNISMHTSPGRPAVWARCWSLTSTPGCWMWASCRPTTATGPRAPRCGSARETPRPPCTSMRCTTSSCRCHAAEVIFAIMTNCSVDADVFGVHVSVIPRTHEHTNAYPTAAFRQENLPPAASQSLAVAAPVPSLPRSPPEHAARP